MAVAFVDHGTGSNYTIIQAGKSAPQPATMLTPMIANFTITQSNSCRLVDMESDKSVTHLFTVKNTNSFAINIEITDNLTSTNPNVSNQ